MFQDLSFLKSIVKPLGIWNFMIYGLIWNFIIYDICFNLIFLSLLHWFQALPKFYCLIFKLYKIILFNLGCNNWIINTTNHIFGRVIWSKFPEYIFENFEISNFSKIAKVIYPKNCPNQTCDYWLTTPKQQTPCVETNIF